MTHTHGLKSAKRLVLWHKICALLCHWQFSQRQPLHAVEPFLWIQGRIPWKDEDTVTEQGFLFLLVTWNYHQWSHIALTSSFLLHCIEGFKFALLSVCFSTWHILSRNYHWYIILEMHKQKNSLRCNAEGAHDVTGNGLCVHLLQEQFPPLGWGNDWDQDISNLINNFHKMKCFGVSAIIWSESIMYQILINPAGSYSAVACTLPVTNTSWLLFSCSVLMITLLCVRW